MKYISDIKELDKIVRNMLILQSGLNANFVRAANSEYGTDLDKKNASIFTSLTQDDVAILFEISARESEANMSEDTKGGIVIYQSFNAHIIIYGQNSLTLAPTLIARLRTEESRELFQTNGVYLELVTTPDKLEEIKNGVIWMRHDFDIHLSCQMLIQPVNTSADFIDYKSLIVYNT